MISVVLLGSDDCEVLDHVFGVSRLCYSFWSRRWEARSLRQLVTQNYVRRILAPVPRDAVVFLTFGATDVNQRLGTLAVELGFFDFRQFVAEIREGIDTLLRLLEEEGFARAVPIFLYPPDGLGEEFYERYMLTGWLPPLLRGTMLTNLACDVISDHGGINCMKRFQVDPDTPFLHPKFYQDGLSGQVSFPRTRDIVREEIIRAYPVLDGFWWRDRRDPGEDRTLRPDIESTMMAALG